MGYSIQIILSLIVCFFISYFSINAKKIFCVKTNNSLQKNIELIENTIQKLEWEIIDNDEDCIFAKPSSNKQVIILFDKNEIYINSVRFGRNKIIAFLYNSNVEKLENEIKLKS